MMTISRRLQAFAGLAAMASLGALAAFPASASAAAASSHATGSAGTSMSRQAVTPSTVLSENCNGDVCMTLNQGFFGPFIQAGANSHGFHGYFHLSGPGGPFNPANSITQQWPAHGVATGDVGTSLQQWSFDSFQTGTYCVSAFADGTQIGMACLPNGIA